MQTTWNGTPVTLSLTEFWIVHALARNPGHVKNRQQLMDAANVVLDDNTITSHIKRMRRKFLADRSGLRCRFRPCTEWAIAGSSEHPLATADRRADHARSCRGPVVNMPVSSKTPCAYRRRMRCESTADTIAQRALGAAGTRVPSMPRILEPFVESQGDLYVFPLRSQPLLDGYREDWGVAGRSEAPADADGYGARLQVGSTDRYLFLYVEVDDPHFDARARPMPIPRKTGSTAST